MPSALDLKVGDMSLESWTKGRDISAWGTNAGATQIAFQSWQHFKEAFAPEIVQRAVSESTLPVRNCADLFGGSGTTPLACQFLGIEPIVSEINPYLADVIEAKLITYDFAALAKDTRKVLENAKKLPTLAELAVRTKGAPPTLYERKGLERWLFDQKVAKQIFALVSAIDKIKNADNRRFLKVMLGGQLVELSNIRINGKGRRYRRNWNARKQTPQSVLEKFSEAVTSAAADLASHRARPYLGYTIIRGDARNAASWLPQLDLVVFSPPYPNSFDYTDVYNVELWMLGYLSSSSDNQALRRSTLASHVQIKRDYARPPNSSMLLDSTLVALEKKKHLLWSKDIPAMIGGYFADLLGILETLRYKLRVGARVYMVVGDSRYAGVTIPVAAILIELAKSCGLDLLYSDPFRSMRTSAQQGGKLALPETLIVLTRAV